MAARTAELTIPAAADYLELVGQFVSFVAMRVGLPESEVARIQLAVDEACANVVLHAASGQEGETFRVVCEDDGECLVIRVRDSGPPFDLDAVPEPDLEAPVEKRQVGGLGIYMMRRVMDRVEVVPWGDGKEVVLVKRLRELEGADDGD